MGISVIESFLKELVEKHGDEEKEKQMNLRYCDGSKQRYYEKMKNNLNNSNSHKEKYAQPS